MNKLTTLGILCGALFFVSAQMSRAGVGELNFVNKGKEYLFHANSTVGIRLGKVDYIEVVKHGGGSWYLCAYNVDDPRRIEGRITVQAIWINFNQLLSLQETNDGRDRIKFIP